jgi:hypothetical protein
MTVPLDLVSRALRAPESLLHFSMGVWDTLVRQARRCGLLARLPHRLEQAGRLNLIPQAARWHFEAAATLAARQQIAVRWEVEKIRDALSGLPFPLIVLKGGAYVVADLPAASGRLFNDLDILVPREHLGTVEAALMLAGWHPSPLSDYDQRYYRRWMHEIPPMQHVKRATVIDVHHAILPDTTRHHPHSNLLASQAVSVAGLDNVRVLAPADMLLHSAAHLFHDGELPHGLRDLSDLDLLLHHFAADETFWSRLAARAGELDLARPLFYALRYARHFLDTPVPASIDDALAHAAPSASRLVWMDAIFTRALAPDHASSSDAFTGLARKAAFVRAHWLRMPPRLLLPHLFHKAFVSPFESAPKAA